MINNDLIQDIETLLKLHFNYTTDMLEDIEKSCNTTSSQEYLNKIRALYIELSSSEEKLKEID